MPRALAAQGVPEALAQRVARLDALFSALDIVEVGSETGRGVDTVAGVYFGVGGRLDLGWLSQQIAALPADSHWQGLARVALRDDLSALARGLARSVLQGAARQHERRRADRRLGGAARVPARALPRSCWPT